MAAAGLDENKTGATIYYKKRIISIAPLYYVVILWYFITENALNLFRHNIPVDTMGIGWFRYIFMLNGFLTNDTYFWGNLGITWTIPIFAFFYLIAPFAMRIVRSSKKAFLMLIFVFVLTKLLLQIYYCSIFSNIYYFFIGILIYYCYKEEKLMFCALGFLVLTMAITIAGGVWYPGFFATMICILLKEKIELPKFAQKIVNTVDEHSYTLYLVHGVVFCSLIDRIGHGKFGIPNYVIGIIAVTASFILTAIVHKYIEKPIQNLLKEKMLSNGR